LIDSLADYEPGGGWNGCHNVYAFAERVLSSIYSVTSIRPNTARVLARDLDRLHWFPDWTGDETFAPGLNYRRTLARAMFGLAADCAHAHAYSAAISGRGPATNSVHSFQ